MAKQLQTICYFGERFTIREITRLARVDIRVFRRRWSRAGRPDDITLLGELLAPWDKRVGRKVEPRAISAPPWKGKSVADDRPGWAERKYFPRAGANGFAKSEKTGINAHCDRCTILPILNGD